MTLHTLPDLEQGSPEWHDQRRGMVTASVMGKLLTIGAPEAGAFHCPACSATEGQPCLSLSRKSAAPIKTFHDLRVAKAAESTETAITVADNETSRALTATLVAERIAGFTEDTPMTSDMWRGVDSEPIARDIYAQNVKEPVSQVGFMVEDHWGFAIGYSPDGLVGERGLLEIKAPRAKTHLLTVLADKVPAYNMAQLQTGLLVSGRDWVDFVPYVGGMPLWVKRVHPDPAWREAIVAAVAQFEKTAAEWSTAYAQATNGLQLTERVLELEMVI